MFIEERHKKIPELLNEKQSITNQEIQERFGISYDTAKRDLRLLEEQGLLKRTQGGAIPLRNIGFQPGIGNLSSKERAQKVLPNYLAIAKRAVQCIEENDVIYITSASIGYLMVQNLPQKLSCTVVTNSISIALYHSSHLCTKSIWPISIRQTRHKFHAQHLPCYCSGCPYHR